MAKIYITAKTSKNGKIYVELTQIGYSSESIGPRTFKTLSRAEKRAAVSGASVYTVYIKDELHRESSYQWEEILRYAATLGLK